MPKDHTAILKGIDRLEIGANRNFSKKCKVLHLESHTDRHWGPLTLKELEILVDTELNIGQQCALAEKDLSWTGLQKILAAGQGRRTLCSTQQR